VVSRGFSSFFFSFSVFAKLLFLSF